MRRSLHFFAALLMTNEMWDLGHTASSFRIALLLVLNFPMLVGLSHYLGFEQTFGVKDDVVDSFAALAVGFTLPAILLYLLSAIGPEMSVRGIVGKISLQAVPASMGAMFARSELGISRDQLRRS